MKLRLVRALQRHVFNPPIRLLFRLGIVPPGYAGPPATMRGTLPRSTSER